MKKLIRKLTLTGAAVAVLSLTFGSSQPASAQVDPYIGQLMLVGFGFCPRGWTDADGQTAPVQQNPALFSLYGTMYGGDGRTTFGLPGLRGRYPMHTGTGPGLSPRPQGQKAGVETVTLTAGEAPVHNHPATTTATLNATTGIANVAAPGTTVVLADGRTTDLYSADANDTTLRSDAIAAGTSVENNTGGGQAHNNMPPFLVLRWCIAVTGTFPPRN